MNQVPTYQDINRTRAEQSAAQDQMNQREAIAKEAQSMSSPNPVLAEYMNRAPQQQGLTPNPSAGDYTMLATQVANNSANQEAYSMAMINAASKGQVPVDAVLSDESILPQYRQGLLNSIRSANQGLGQVR